jgi:hypothetical protein
LTGFIFDGELNCLDSHLLVSFLVSSVGL